MREVSAKSLAFLVFIASHPGVGVSAVIKSCTRGTAAEVNSGRVACHRLEKRGMVRANRKGSLITLTITRRGLATIAGYRRLYGAA